MKNKKNKILVLLPSYDSGGAENYILRLIKYEANKNFSWYVTSGNLKNEKLICEFKKCCEGVFLLSPGFFSANKFFAFYKLLRRMDFDSLMTMTGEFSAVALLASYFSNIPKRIVWHRRSTPAYESSIPKKFYSYLALKIIYKFSTNILSNSEYALETFHKGIWRNDRRYIVIRNGVDSNKFMPNLINNIELRNGLGIPLDSFVIGHVGRFDPAKDHVTLLKIFIKISKYIKNAKLLVVGTGTNSLEFMNMLYDFNLVNDVYTIGAVNDVEKYYCVMNLFLFPSITEGQPNALIEAMLSGVPIVATNIEPIKETVPEIKYHNLFNPGDITSASDIVYNIYKKGNFIDHETLLWAKNRYNQKKNFDELIKIINIR